VRAYYDNDWHQAKVKAQLRDGYEVVFDEWPEYIETVPLDDVKQLEQASRPMSGFQVGDKVVAIWEGDEYDVKILKTNDRSEEAYCEFKEYNPEWIVYSDLRKSAPEPKPPSRKPHREEAVFRKGDVIEAKFEGEYADARVLSVGRKEVEVEWVGFEDDPSEWISTKDARPKKKQPSPPRLPSPPRPQFVKGDIVLAEFEGKPADARIVQVNGPEVQIEWVGFEDDPKEWKDIKNITKKDNVPDVPGAAPKEPEPAYRTGDVAQAPFEGEMFPCRIIRIDGEDAKVEWIGFDDASPSWIFVDQIQPAAENTGHSKPEWQEGDECMAEFEGEMYPAVISRVKRGKFFVIFDEFPDDGEAKTARVEPRDADSANVGGKSAPKFEMDQKVEVDGELGYIKESKGRGEYRVKIRSSGEYHTYHESEIIPILTNQDRCVCVFAVYKERKISLNRYNNICKTLFGRWVRDFTEVIENRDGKVVFTQAEIPEYEEEYLQWVGDLPEKPSHCPDLPDILCGEWVNTENSKGRVKRYNAKEGIWSVDVDGILKEFTRDQLTKQLSLRDKAMQVFGAAGKTELTTSEFKGIFMKLFADPDNPDRGPPRIEKIRGEEENPWSKVKINENNGRPYSITWKGKSLPPCPPNVPDLPKFFKYESVLFTYDGQRKYGRVHEIDEGEQMYTIRYRYRSDGDDAVDGWAEEYIEVPEQDLEVKREASGKIKAIFGIYQKQKLTFDEIRLALWIYFEEKVNSVRRMLENVSAVSVHEDSKMAEWYDDNDIPPRMPEHRCLIMWRKNAKVDVYNDNYWTPCTVLKCLRKDIGQFLVEPRRGDDREEFECSVKDMRRSVSIVDKVRAVFGVEQKYSIHVETMNEHLSTMFQDRGLQLPLNENVEEALGKESIVVRDDDCFYYEYEKLPPTNLLDIWNNAVTLDIRKKVKSVFVRLNKTEITVDEFQEVFHELFDKRLGYLEEKFEQDWNWQYEYDPDTQRITFEGDLEDDSDDENGWLKDLTKREIDWGKTERDVKQEYYVEDSRIQARTEEEELAYRERNSMVYEGEMPWPRPARTFEEAFERYEKNSKLTRCVEVFFKEFKREGFTSPTPIQQACWPLVDTGRDVLGISKTGSGKTLGFGLPMLLKARMQKMSRKRDRRDGGNIFGLILNHTRELCIQTWRVLKAYGEQIDVNVCRLHGKQDRYEVNDDLRRGIDLLCATQGRLLDQMKRKKISLVDCVCICLDEADQMLKGTEGHVRDILLSKMRPGSERQCLLFSATYSSEVEELHHGFYVNKPIKISIGAKTVRADPKVKQHFAFVGSRNEMEPSLIKAIQSLFGQNKKRLFIFFNSKRQCDETFYRLERADIPDARLCRCHGDMDQPDREAAIRDFKAEMTNILLCTDVISRGINILNTTVIQYGFPDRDQSDSMPRETYIHRLGRAGRADATGECYTLFYEQPRFNVWEILEDVDQVGPAALASHEVDLSVYEEIPRDLPDWAMGRIPSGSGNSFQQRSFTSPSQMKSHASSSKIKSGKNFGGMRVNIWWEEDQKTYPGLCETDNGRKATVVFDDFPDETHTVDSSNLKALGDNVLAPIASNEDSWKGKRVAVDFFDEGEFLATVADDYQNGEVLVVFDDEFPDETVAYDRLRELESPSKKSESSKPKVSTSSIPGFVPGDRVTVHYSDGDDYPAKVLRITPSGKYEVQFDAFDEPEEIDFKDLSSLKEEIISHVEETGFSTNQRVKIHYSDGEIYHGEILECKDDDMYLVKFDLDFPDEELAADDLEPEDNGKDGEAYI